MMACSPDSVFNAAALMLAAMTDLNHVELRVKDQRSVQTGIYTSHVCEKAIVQLLSSLPRSVSHLSLTSLDVLNEGIWNALASMPCLDSLLLCGIPNITMEALINLVECVKGLKRLQMVACKGIRLPECKALEKGYGGHAFRVEFDSCDLSRFKGV